MCLRRIGLVAATSLASLALAAPALAAGERARTRPTGDGGSSPTGPPATTPVQQVKPGAGASDVPASYLRLYRRAARARESTGASSRRSARTSRTMDGRALAGARAG
jgi:hypothetical protein